MCNIDALPQSPGRFLIAGVNKVTLIFLKVSLHYKEHHGSLLSSLDYWRNANSSSKCFFTPKQVFFFFIIWRRKIRQWALERDSCWMKRGEKIVVTVVVSSCGIFWETFEFRETVCFHSLSFISFFASCEEISSKR